MAKPRTLQGSNANDNRSDRGPTEALTDKQGQYLAYIALYTKLHRRPPAETDMQEYFQVTPPTAHRMVVELEQKTSDPVEIFANDVLIARGEVVITSGDKIGVTLTELVKSIYSKEG